jgi:hypothetical protein
MANLARARIEGTEFHWADLEGTNFKETFLPRANFFGANLTDASYGSNVPMTKPPGCLIGFRWPVVLLDTHIKIGCELHLTTEWEAFSCQKIDKMHSEAQDWWWEHREVVLTLARLHAKGLA